MKSPAIEVHDLTVAYRAKPVLWDIDFSIPEGEMVGIVGPNGAGKSTLMKAILGLVPISSGWVQIRGEPISKDRSSTLGYVPQRESVDWDFPVTVLDVVLMGTYGRLGWFRRPRKAEREWAQDCLEGLGISDLASRQISELSGGQQQRVFLARALAQDSEIYLMDEPFAGVDAATEEAIVALLKKLRARGRTVMVIHHDLQTVENYFDRVLLINLRLVAAGPTREVFTRENLLFTYGGRLTVLDEAAEAVRLAHGNAGNLKRHPDAGS
ncbi:MAG TPA: metal ABC transporter ATP-binding protein [Planctomycetes bacterium]|nr:metal ABC transporter ATP-binding protein [Planctomycetota bacterium]HIN80094.1 metal ABC transporter ATP-binding protein [Planctomycetota bacterium]